MDQDAFSEYQEPQSQDESKEPVTEEGSPPPAAETIHLPKEFLQGAQVKPGQVITVKVLSADDDGVEVEYAGEPGNGMSEGGMSANDEIDAIDAQDSGG